jgi:uncharacterized Tic20 family protein
MQQGFSQSSETKYTQVTSDERTLAVITHVFGIFFSFFPALIIYLLKKDESPYVAEHAKEALNFQLSVAIYATASLFLILVLIGIFLLIAIGVGAFILAIIATVKANDDILYRYPFCIRLIK